MTQRLGTALAISCAMLAFAANARAATFDARNATDYLSVLSSNGASGVLKKDDKGRPYIAAKAGAAPFLVLFADCNTKGDACATVVFIETWSVTSITLDQINRWNKWTTFCPIYLTSENEPSMSYSLRASPNDKEGDVVDQVSIWQDCLIDLDKFTDAPEVFLKAHPG